MELVVKKILIASTNPWWFSMAVEQDIAKENSAHRVDVINLFRLCSGASPHWRPIDRKVEAVNRKFKRFVAPYATGSDITNCVRLEGSIPEPPSSIDSLRGYAIGDARIGLAVLSSLATITTIQNPLNISEYGPAFAEAWKSAHLSEQVGRAVSELGYDEVYIFNGRFCYSRPFCDVLQSTSKVFRFEQGANGNRYIKSIEGVHNPRAVANLIGEHDFDVADGESFYLDRLKKAPGNPVEFFTINQTEGKLSEKIGDEPVVSLFTSSTDEMYAINDNISYGTFPNQFQVALALARACNRTKHRLVIRLHPHLEYKHSSWKREWDFGALAAEGAVILEPSDSTDSYALMRASRCVFTCGSTVGLECSYLGVPSAEVGEWTGSAIGAVATVLDEKEVEAFIRNPAAPEQARSQAIRLGSYLRRSGKLLPALDMQNHPYYTRLGGKIVDPVRYVYQRIRAAFTRSPHIALPPGGKNVVQLSVRQAMAKRRGEDRGSKAAS